MADPAALQKVYGKPSSASKFLTSALEKRSRQDALKALEKAYTYEKNAKAFKALGALNPSTLSTKLPSFKRVCSQIVSVIRAR